jgi:hypothetical protein
MNAVIESRFSGCFEIEQIRQRVTVRPEPLRDLSRLNPVIAGEVIMVRLKQIFLPNQFSLAFIQEMVGRADLFTRSVFTNERDYQAKIYNPPDIEVAPICLSGLAGVGKSETVAALMRLLPSNIEFESSHFQDKVPLVSHWYASARDKARGRQLLAEFLLDSGPAGKSTNASQLLNLCRRIVYRHGVSLLLLDETQHIVKGQGTALVTDILLTLARIGLPMIYLANYSLLHKLLGRNQEDTQRLLTQPRVMQPDDPAGQDWKAYVAECVRVSSGQIRANEGEFASELYRLTFGLKRLAVHLLSLAYIECRKAGRSYIVLGDLSQAYRSTEYSSSRVDVEELYRIGVEGPRGTKRKDLYCPLDIPAHKSNIVQFAMQERDERVTALAIDSSMTLQERETIKHIESASRSPHAKLPRLKPLPKATLEETQVAFAKYVEQTKSGKPKKPK